IDEGFTPHDVVDVGCGTAVLAMAAARMWPETVLACDIDSQAVDVAQANVLANSLTGRVDVVEAAGFDHARLTGPFDLIFANILKGPLLALAPDLMGRLKPNGFAILSGILNEQADEVIDHYCAAGANLHQRQQIVDWTTLTFTTAS
ncbi:MAG: 50S ribosomal protein L11 methyltransferase, partial [Paracoccaceae bacterium]